MTLKVHNQQVAFPLQHRLLNQVIQFLMMMS
jgi:hypothetical protein